MATCRANCTSDPPSDVALLAPCDVASSTVWLRQNQSAADNTTLLVAKSTGLALTEEGCQRQVGDAVITYTPVPGSCQPEPISNQVGERVGKREGGEGGRREGGRAGGGKGEGGREGGRKEREAGWEGRREGGRRRGRHTLREGRGRGRQTLLACRIPHA
jgi:hypothetical protein